MRFDYVTENTIDLASDINKSFNQIDGIIPMNVIVTVPELKDAVFGLYYLQNNKVITCDEYKTFWIESQPILISISGNLHVFADGSYKKVLDYSPDVISFLNCKNKAEMKAFLDIK